MSRTKDPLDVELFDIINRLNKIQEEVGGGPIKEEKDEKKSKIDKFTDVERGIQERLHSLIEKLEASKSGGMNPREVIQLKSEIRSDMGLVTEEWNELNLIFMGEAKKKKSKLSAEEIERRQKSLVLLQEQINDIKETQRAGFVQGYTTQKLVRMEDSEIFKPRKAGDEEKYDSKNTAARNQNISQQQQMALMRIKERDKLIDEEIDEIDKGVDQLGELARMANSELKLHSVIINNLEEKMDNVHEKVLTLNEKMKTTLEEARSSDKLCVDIFCLLLSIGLIIVLVKLTTGK